MQGGYGQTDLTKYLQKLRRKMQGVKVLVARTVGCGHMALAPCFVLSAHPQNNAAPNMSIT
jgi:hypothetical protein